MKTINDYCCDAFNNAVLKGWHEKERTIGDQIALMHSELSEAFEEFRNGYRPDEIYFSDGRKPEGIPIELADCIIRIFDFCGKYDIDLEQAIKIKMEYNETRPHRHGGKQV